jgi:twitching motility protein PilT
MRQVTTLGASDLHIKAGSPPYLRLNSDLTPIPGMYGLSPDELDVIVRELTRQAPNRLHEFELSGECDLSYELRGCARFRVNVFRQRSDISIALRVIPDEVPTLKSLNLPPVIETLASQPRGLVLVTGATGSGKSTTLAAMIDYINERTARHIVTIEDPIEMVHTDKKSLINQREIGTDTGTFGGALRRALRQDPDIILIGEMRDEETVRAALSAAETGHLVFSTLHTIDVMESIYRVLDFFPAALERQARSMLAGTLKGVVSQRLLRTVDGRSRVPAVEVMVGTSRISDAIANPAETSSILEAVSEGAYYGMQTFDQSLLQLVLDKAVSVEEAMAQASSKQNFALLLEANNVKIEGALRRVAAGNHAATSDTRKPQQRRNSPAPGSGAPNARPVPGAAPAAPAADAAPFLSTGWGATPANGQPRRPQPQPGIKPDQTDVA